MGEPGELAKLLVDPQIIRTKARRFKAAMPRVHPHYAVKANPHPAVLRTLHFRFKALVFAGETVRCVATVTAVAPDPDGAGDLVTVESTIEVVGDKGRVAVAPAGATVVVPR